jgi:hypothetical protein
MVGELCARRMRFDVMSDMCCVVVGWCGVWCVSKARDQ